MSRNDFPSSGFTAVNGERQSSTAFRPGENITSQSDEHAHSKEPSVANVASPVQYLIRGWRADSHASHTPHLLTAEPRKRKRSDSLEANASETVQSIERHADGSKSPKRRVMQLDSAIDVTSPANGHPSSNAFPPIRPPTEPVQVGAYLRQRSPTQRWNQGEPPPRPRPEIEAGLAESLQRELQSVEEAHAQAQSQKRTEAEAPAKPHSHDQLYAHAPTPTHPEQAHGPPHWQSQLHTPAQPQGQSRSPDPAQPGVQSPRSPVDGTAYQRQQRSYSPDQSDDPKKRKRNFSNRTKTGCHTCRTRKKKCDERKPTCQNCERGGFNCGGYGPKPPGGYKLPTTASRAPVTLQSKPMYEASHGPAGYYPSSVDEQGRTYSHWGRVPYAEQDHVHASSADLRQLGHTNDAWPVKPSTWPPAEPPAPYLPPRLPPADFATIPPLHGPFVGHPAPPPPPPPPPIDPWSADHSAISSFRQPTSAGGMLSARDSGTTTSSQRTAAMALSYNPHAQISEKEKMILGRPFLHFIEPELLVDRQQCKGALERYNDAARSTSHLSHEERGRLFRAIVDPIARPEFARREDSYTGPQGHVGRHTIVDSPFTCEYGYNINIGDEVVIQSGCHMQDACDIRVGNRTIIGPNVKFYGITASVDATARKGSQGCVQGGAIKIGDDCFIGGDVVILPYRKIGNGAVVGAGSIVTKDVKENTVVAGNPAKVIRRIEQGPNIDRHHPDIQEQNEKMLQEMWETAKRRGCVDR